MTKIAELRQFVAVQGLEDASLSPAERRHQKRLVTDVLRQEVSNAKLLRELISDYSSQITH